MAVVFISPRQRQRMFFTGITIVVGLFLIVIAFVIFFSQPKEVSKEVVFNKPKVTINFEIFDSDQFKSLEPVGEMQVQFFYEAKQDGQEIKGYISAVSSQEAEKILTELGYQITDLQEALIGRLNPFEPYTSTNLENTQTEETITTEK